MKNICIIPCYAGSSRLLRKALLAETGKPLFVHTYYAAYATKIFDEIYVAAPVEEFGDLCKQYRIPHLITKFSHTSGTSRVNEAIKLLDHHEIETVTVWQVDYPISPHFDDTLQLIKLCKTSLYSTLICSKGYKVDKNDVKVIINSQGEIIYYTRHHIRNVGGNLLIHIGIYCFTLNNFLTCLYQVNPLAYKEDLEQLHWIGIKQLPIAVFTDKVLSINTQEDYDEFKRICGMGPQIPTSE